MKNKHISVENIIYEKSKLTLILESPHKNEICEGYPLAGQSGKEISKYLIKESILPFGEEVKKGFLIDKVSILNVSKFPLQGNAYCCSKNKPSDINIYEKLKELMDRGADVNTKHNNKEINNLKKEIYILFLSELKKLPNKSFIVPCGKFARDFCNHSKLEESLKDKEFVFIDEDIPHPARGWANIQKKTIQIIKEKI